MQQIGLLETKESEHICLPDADLSFIGSIFNQSEAQALMKSLMSQIDWQTETIKIAGVDKLSPRLTAWYGDTDASYRYSGIDHKPRAWTQALLQIKSKIEAVTGESFNSALCNLYRNGQDSVAWHSDDEPDLFGQNGEQPIIASLSLGVTRKFQMKHKTRKDLRHHLSLTSGSLLLMAGNTQSHWQHQIPKEPGIEQARINITFRKIYGK